MRGGDTAGREAINQVELAQNVRAGLKQSKGYSRNYSTIWLLVTFTADDQPTNDSLFQLRTKVGLGSPPAGKESQALFEEKPGV